METRPLNQKDIARLASGQGVENISVTCRDDKGYGPCGTYLDWLDGTCSKGHVIEVILDDHED